MKRTIRMKVAACGGELIAWYVEGPKSATAYYSREQREAGAGIDVSYRRDDKETPINSVADLINTIRRHGCSPVAECAAHPVDFATLCGFLLRHARVIDSPELWGFLDEGYGVASRELLPRMDGSRLLYATTARTDGLLSHIIRISVDFATTATEQTRIEIKAA